MPRCLIIRGTTLSGGRTVNEGETLDLTDGDAWLIRGDVQVLPPEPAPAPVAAEPVALAPEPEAPPAEEAPAEIEPESEKPAGMPAKKSK